MQVFVKAKPNAKIESLSQLDKTHFVIAVREPARKNKANEAVVKILAKHFGIAPSRIYLLSGSSSKQKRFKIQ